MSGPSTTSLLWSSPTRPRRGPRPRVSLDEIVATGVRIADAEGLDAASMQRVADELGLTKMALYRYVPGRAELVELMIDSAMGTAPTALDGPWRGRLEAWASAMRDVFSAHRWLLVAAVGPRPFGPNELGWSEAGLGAIAGLPLSAAEQLDTLAVIGAQVRGLVAQAVENEVEARLGAALSETLAAHAGTYPRAAAAFGAVGAAEDGERERAPEFGLERLLDGIEAFIARRVAGE